MSDAIDWVEVLWPSQPMAIGNKFKSCLNSVFCSQPFWILENQLCYTFSPADQNSFSLQTVLQILMRLLIMSCLIRIYTICHSVLIFDCIPIWNNGSDQICWRLESPLLKFRGERVRLLWSMNGLVQAADKVLRLCKHLTASSNPASEVSHDQKTVKP